MMLLQASASSVHSLLIIAERPSICDAASKMNASDLEHMHLCSYGMPETLPSSKYASSVKRSGMNTGISSWRGCDTLGVYTVELHLFYASCAYFALKKILL